jgi:signal transduction histidine kinase/CheY-like chemotaxis protein/HPt (histidine-containing phosphotransfer) domain-containing protein
MALPGPGLRLWRRSSALALMICRAFRAFLAQHRHAHNGTVVGRVIPVLLLLFLLSAAVLAKSVHDRQTALTAKSRYNIIWAVTRMAADLNRFAQNVAELPLVDPEQGKKQLMVRADIVKNRLSVMSNGEFADFTASVPAQHQNLIRIRKEFDDVSTRAGELSVDGEAVRDLLDELGSVQIKVAELVSSARAYSGDREQYENSELVRLHLTFLVIVGGLVIFGFGVLLAVKKQYALIKSSNTKLQEVASDLRLTTVSRQYLDAAISNMSHGLCLTGSADQIIIWNSQLVKMFCISSKAKLQGTSLFELLSEKNSECGSRTFLNGMLGRMQTNRQSGLGSLFVHEFGDGRAIAISQLRIESGWLVTFEDVTQRRREEEEKLQAIADAEQARGRELAAEASSRAKSSFLASMSHEIRTPMNGVFGMTDLLMRTELTERQQRLVNTINQSAKSLLAIINDVLDVSRIEAGKLVLDHSDFDLRKCIEETADLLAETAQKKGLELTLLVKPEVPSRVVGDVGRLRQVCTNIIANAVKFTEIGEVAITVTCPERADGAAEIEIKIRDSGIGISADVQKRLFQPFEQADNSIARRFGGTGLGLTITKHLIEKMGGQISLTSEPGAGSEFTIRLPLLLSSEICPASVQEPTSLSGSRILVLDDRATNREIMASYLSEAGAEVTCVETPEAALQALRAAQSATHPFAIAIIDMVLPGSSGLDVADMIKADAALADVRLIMVTSLSWKGDIQFARDHGFQSFLTKPVHRTELVDTAIAALARSEKAEPGSAGRPSELERGNQRSNLGTRVLVAEDNPVNVEVAKEFLGGLNCSITLASNGSEAIAAFSQSRFDIILMDCQMPEMDGLTATQRIREIEKARGLACIPIVAVTANAFEEDRVRCLAAGMDDFLSKPFTEDQLHQMLLKWAKQSNAGGHADEIAPIATEGVSLDGGRGKPAKEEANTLPSVQTPAGRLDEELLERLRSSHPALLARLIEAYVRIAPELSSQLVVAAADINREVMRTVAHSLKSSSANVGAAELSNQCRDLEFRLRTEPPADARALQPLVDAIELELRAVIDQLQSRARDLRQRAGIAGPAKSQTAANG